MDHLISSVFATLLCLYIIHSPVDSVKSKYVMMNLRSHWNSTPLLSEAAEYMAVESNEKFWRFVNLISEDSFRNNYYNEMTDESLYNNMLQLAGQVLSDVKIYLLKFALSLRSHSPAVEMHNQLAKTRREDVSCEAFVDVNNKITCKIFELSSLIDTAAQSDRADITLLRTDHIYPGSEKAQVKAVLYADLGSEAFHKWHETLKTFAQNGQVCYVLRHFVKEEFGNYLRLSGYGVELALKSQEYKAKDDSKVEGEQNMSAENELEKADSEEEVEGIQFVKLKNEHPELSKGLADFRRHLLDSSSEMAALKVWQFQDLSFQAAQMAVNSEPDKALATLRDISQNFPLQTKHLVKTTVNKDLRKEVQRNQKEWERFGLQPGDSALYINGITADLDVYDVFMLLDTLRSEANLMEGLYSLGVTGNHLNDLLKAELSSPEGANFALDFRDESIVWINDLEKDRMYQGWPRSIMELLRPTFPGMMRQMRKNMFNLLVMIDMADPEQYHLLKMLESFVVHSPIRVGILFLCDPDNVRSTEAQEAGMALIRGFNFVTEKERAGKGLAFLTDVFHKAAEVEAEITAQFVYDVTTTNLRLQPESKDIMTPSAYNGKVTEAFEFFKKTGLHSLPQALVNGVPLPSNQLTPDNFEEGVLGQVMEQTPELQRAVFSGYLHDGLDVIEYLATRSNVMPRLNYQVFSTDRPYLDFIAKTDISASTSSTQEFSELTSPEMTVAVSDHLKYMTKTDDEASSPVVTVWVITDLDTATGRALVYEGIRQVISSSATRLAVIHNPLEVKDLEQHQIALAIQAAVETLSSAKARSFVAKLVKEDIADKWLSGSIALEDIAVHMMDVDAYKKSVAAQNLTVIQNHRVFCHNVLKIDPGHQGIVVNGKIIGTVNGNDFIKDDFALMEKFTRSSSADKLFIKIKEMDLASAQKSDLVMKTTALLQPSPQDKLRISIGYHATTHSVINLPARDPDSPAFEVIAILDPTTRASQKYTPLIMVLQKIVNVNIKVFMNCRGKLSEMPLKSFYRYVLDPEVTFNSGGNFMPGPYARFNDMPLQPILTLGVDSPESWMVQSVRTKYDLDNIHLQEVEHGVDADFVLEYTLLEGHCFDQKSSQPPRGLQFTLSSNSSTSIMDTIVMANLGYFQLKAFPGLWQLNLRPGRSSEIYDIVSHEDTDSPPDSPKVLIVMDSFKSKIIKVKVSKKPGKDSEDLLSEPGDNEASGGGGLWDSISSKFTGTKTESTDDQQINVFSLASGHMYERLLRIMILSVLKHTKTHVKFWFLKNYLSPTFKQFLPIMADKYGFDYELIQYKWPRWLHQQSEKQRVMWGYKILFLDVLFPLNVSKIIFVDADQIVRADLQELIDMDLEGAPYGYVPFCESRTDMDGYRFWKSGYWASHLGNRRYHISALYVVDLKKFRKIAAGDRLRGQYQGLSQDPNSLSNLDQDLPNNMIHQVAIKSLPQEWLWCETWCSDSEKAQAKTIDLCNNPRTKEPKLTAAQRIVTEWTTYDNEVRQLWDSVYTTKPKDEAIDTTKDTKTESPKKTEL